MNKLTKMAVLALGTAMASHGAYAAAGDLIIGFNGYSTGSPASATDYIADLGAISTFTVNDNLSAALTGQVPSYSTGLNVGAVADTQTGSGLTLRSTLYATTLRVGGGSYTSAGTELAPDAVTSRANMNNAASLVGGLSTGAQSSGNGNSWSQTISLAPSTTGAANNNFVNYLHAGGASGPVATQNSPMANFGGSQILVEDLWQNVNSTSLNPAGTWAYVGDLTIDLSGSSPVVTYDLATAVPEPSTFGIFAGAGLLLIALRRQFVRNAA